jgi:hypothetical protein
MDCVSVSRFFVAQKERSAKYIWEAAERVKRQPVKLATAHETFTKKPKDYAESA